MIRIPRKELDDAIDAILECWEKATDSTGARVVTLALQRKEAAIGICGLLGVMGKNYVTPSDVFFMTMEDDGKSVQFPPTRRKEDAA